MILMMALAQLSSCQQIKEKDYEISVEVVDQDNKPIEGVKLVTGKLVAIEGSDLPICRPVLTNPVSTDREGQALLKFKSYPEPDGPVSFSKEGYYGTSEPAPWDSMARSDSNRRLAIHAIMKPLKNPIPMYAKSNLGERKCARIPELGKEYGFDLMLAQPLPPLGSGKLADFYFRVEGDYVDRHSSDLKFVIRFSGKHDGLVEFLSPRRVEMGGPREMGSHLISDYFAPEGGYVSTITRFCRVEANGNGRFTDVDLERNFYFRTRTQTLPDGTITNAHYGKIYGDLNCSRGNIEKGFYANFDLMISYFNPTPNDRNVEFDTKRNLIPDGNVHQP